MFSMRIRFKMIPNSPQKSTSHIEIIWCKNHENPNVRKSGLLYCAAWKKKQPVMKAKYYFPDFLNNLSEDHAERYTTSVHIKGTGSRDRFQNV
jgi:hypothetical protein